MRLSRGMSTPAMRAMCSLRSRAVGNRQWAVEMHPRLPTAHCPLPRLSLSLLVPRVLADDPNHTVTANHLALFTARLDRCLNFHVTPGISCQQSAISHNEAPWRLT